MYIRIHSYIFWAVCLFYLFFFQHFYGQNWASKKFTVSDGLMSNQLDALFIDSKGLLWIANGNGLSRYDGKHFLNYVNDSLLTPISKVNQYSIIKLSDGSIFYSMKYGYVKTSNKRKGYLDVYLSDTISEERGVNSRSGIRFFKEGFVDFDFNNNSIRNHVFKKYPKNYKYPSNLLSTNLGSVIYSFYNSDKDVRNIFLFENNSFKEIWDSVPFIMAGIFEDADHYFIIPEEFNVSNPIVIINKQNGTKTFLRKKKNIPEITLLGNAYFTDRYFVFPALEGVLVLTSKNEQVFIKDNLPQKIKNKDDEKFYHSLYLPISKYQNFLVNGYRLIDLEKLSITIPEVIEKEIINSNYIIEVLPDEEGNIWYATFDGLLQVYTLPYEKLYEISEERIAEINDSLETNRFKCFKDFEGIEYCLTNDFERVQILIPKIKNKFYKYSFVDNKVTPIYVEGVQSPVLRERLYPIMSHKKLIVCQEYTRGLVIYRLSEGLDTAYYSLFNYSNGLLSNYVENVFADKNDNIWIITWDGIQMISYNDLLNENYSFNIKYSKSLKLNMIPFKKDDEIYFADGSVLYKISTEKAILNKKPPTIIVENISYKIGKQSYQFLFEQNKTYELFYNTRDLSVEVLAVCLSDGAKVKYKFVVDSMMQFQNEGKLMFSDLKPGKHTIEIYACNNLNVWSAQPIRFYINVLPPFWETWWFRILVLVSTIFIVVVIVKKREYDLKEKQKELELLVQERTKELEEKNILIEQKNRDILDSINYTRRLQRSSLPSEREVNKIFHDSFVIYQPKDIIAGDFYFTGLIRTNDGNILKGAVVGDCTGHGVPGAFMSILMLAYVKQSLVEKDVNSPAEALEFVSKKIQKVLEYKNEVTEIKDSADIVFAVLNEETNTLLCACANNPIYIVRNKELIEIPAQKRTVGYCDNQEPFKNHIFQLQKNDMIYLFTDGYADQFGGNSGSNKKDKKFTKKRFKDVLKEVSVLDINQQKQRLLEEHLKWKGDNEQTDDICIIGIRV
ncbi:MAG: hypothetical protein KatS3mg027_2257 [Bacteroidia bacterium]|nr:MAG: hypothetical protein KatS3mg027_2257 [Bacteroidia bacterium]